MKKVMLGLPTMSYLHTNLALLISVWISEAANKGIELSIYPTSGVQPVDNARNVIVQEFLASNATHLFFIDADTIPPRDAIWKMLEHDKDMVTAITPIVESDDGFTFYRKSNVVGLEGMPIASHHGLQRAIAAGSSCILIKRKVFEGLPKPYYRFEYIDDQIVSEDIFFTRKAFAVGFELWADTDLLANHYKPSMW